MASLSTGIPRDIPTNVCGWLKVVDDEPFSTRFLYHLISDQWSTMSFDYVMKAHPSYAHYRDRLLNFQRKENHL